jgi:predicted TIM-barrel fold metal-dependent hydrolase
MSKSVALVAAFAVALRAHSKAQTRKALKALLAAIGTYGLVRILSSFSRACIGLPRERSPCEIWAAKREEDAVEPELRIFDPHHHFFDFYAHDKPGFTSPMMKLIALLKPSVLNGMFTGDKKTIGCFGKRLPFAGNFLAKHLLEDIRGKAAGGHNVVGTMYMECGWQTPGVEKCMEPAGEVDMVEAVHRENPGICQAMVAFADLTLGKDVEPLLERYGKNPFVKGIRHSLWFPDDELLQVNTHATKDTAKSAKFREAFALLSKHGLRYDSWLCHDNLEDLADLAKSFPEQKIICDHIGFPLGIGKYKLEETTPVWKARMTTGLLLG